MNQKEVTNELEKFLSLFTGVPPTLLEVLVKLRLDNSSLFSYLARVGVDHSIADERMRQLAELAKVLWGVTSDFVVVGFREEGDLKREQNKRTSGEIRFAKSGKDGDYEKIIPFDGVPVFIVRSFCALLIQDRAAHTESSVRDEVVAVAQAAGV